MHAAVPYSSQQAGGAQSRTIPYRSRRFGIGSSLGYAAFEWLGSTWCLRGWSQQPPGITPMPATQPLSKRPLSRNGGYDCYRAALADETAWARARRPKRCKLAINPWLRQAVARKLRLNWAPEQIAGWLKRAHPDGGFYRVSHETIYRSLFVQARGVLKKELLGHLRSKRTIRRSQRTDPNGDRRGQIKDLVSIRERPAAVEDRAVPGHWEGDLLSGSNNSYIATLVERHTRYVMLVKIANKDTQTVVSALITQNVNGR